MSTEYDSNNINRPPRHREKRAVETSNTNLIHIQEIKDFKISEDPIFTKLNTAENLSNTNLNNISNILEDNKETLDEYINTNHFDLLTEESIKGTEIMLPRVTIMMNQPINRIDYEDILDDCWPNVSK